MPPANAVVSVLGFDVDLDTWVLAVRGIVEVAPLGRLTPVGRERGGCGDVDESQLRKPPHTEPAASTVMAIAVGVFVAISASEDVRSANGARR
jgi:hypothetical protein